MCPPATVQTSGKDAGPLPKASMPHLVSVAVLVGPARHRRSLQHGVQPRRRGRQHNTVRVEADAADGDDDVAHELAEAEGAQVGARVDAEALQQRQAAGAAGGHCVAALGLDRGGRQLQLQALEEGWRQRGAGWVQPTK